MEDPKDRSGAAPRNNKPLMAAICIAIAAFIGLVCSQAFDNDVWFILATGREIAENGIPYTNPFSIHDDMQIIVQQWLPCVISYAVYTAGEAVGIGGFAALTVLLAALMVLLAASLYCLGRLLKRDSFGGEWILLAVLLTMLGASSYMSMRPHIYTMLAFAWVVYICARYRFTGSWKTLVPLPFIVAAHINFHMAMAPFDLVVIACFLIPDFMKPLHRRGILMREGLSWATYPRLPLLVALVVCVVAMLANPYGVRGALYLVLSYGSAEYGDIINEMHALAPWGNPALMAAVVMLVLAAIAIGRRGLGKVDLPLTLLVLGCAVLAFMHTRNAWLMAFFCLPTIAEAMHGWSVTLTAIDAAKPPARRARRSSGARVARKGAGSQPGVRVLSVAATWVLSAVAAVTLVVGVAMALPGVEKEADDKMRPVKTLVEGMAESHAKDVAQAQERAQAEGADGADGAEVGAGVAKGATDAAVAKDASDAGSAESVGEEPRLFNTFNNGAMIEWLGYKVAMDPRPELWNSVVTGKQKDYYREYVDLLNGDVLIDVFLKNYRFNYIISENKDINRYLEGADGWTNILGSGDYELWKRS